MVVVVAVVVAVVVVVVIVMVVGRGCGCRGGGGVFMCVCVCACVRVYVWGGLERGREICKPQTRCSVPGMQRRTLPLNRRAARHRRHSTEEKKGESTNDRAQDVCQARNRLVLKGTKRAAQPNAWQETDVQIELAKQRRLRNRVNSWIGEEEGGRERVRRSFPLII